MTEDDLGRKTNFNGKRPLIGCIVYYLKKMFMTPHLDSYSTTDLDQKSYRLSKPEKEFHVMEEMYAALCMCAYAKKMTFFSKDD